MIKDHFEPLEYRVAFTVFKEMNPKMYNSIDNEVKKYLSCKGFLNPIYLLSYINEKHDVIGDTLHSMYLNVYRSLFEKKTDVDLYKQIEFDFD